MTDVIKDAFKIAEESLKGFKGISVVEVDSGLSYGSHCVDDNFDLDAASAYNAEVVKAKVNARNAMGIPDEIELMIIELTNQIHLIKPTFNDKLLIYLAVGNVDNLGVIRLVMKKISEKIDKEFKFE